MKKPYMHLVITIIVIGILIGIPLSTIIKKQFNQFIFDGELTVDGTKLKNKLGEEIQLRGVSSHGIQWDDATKVIKYENLKKLKNEWGINVFRIAMYTSEAGYIENPEMVKSKVIDIIDMCIELNLYVIVDWHILSDNDPNMYKKEAIEFFYEISSKYKKVPNVIYEICNEPSGDNVKWKDDIVPYATDVIKVIRTNSPNAIIIVGTADWSKDLLSVSYNPLPVENVLYAFHFYSGNHKDLYRKYVEIALNRGIPIFVSEWGASSSLNLEGSIYEEETRKWIEFLNENNISWINWSFSNLYEPTSIIKPGKLELLDENLTESGKLIKEILIKLKN